MNPIEKYLRESGLRQQQLAELVGVAPGMISDWSRDKRHPSLAHAFKLEKATGGKVPASSWVGRERAA